MRRSGFTLMEMALVLMIVVVAAGIALPLVDSLLHPNQLAAAIDAVRTNWEATRARAETEGRPYRFSVTEGGNTFRIEPDDADVNQEQGYTIDGVLPETCLFVPNGTGMVDPAATPSGSGNFTTVAVFLPDGTARDNVELSFGRPGLMAVTLRLQFVTGVISRVDQGKGVSR